MAGIQAGIIKMQENLNRGAGENQPNETNLVLMPPLEMADKATKPSLWLYQMVRELTRWFIKEKILNNPDFKLKKASALQKTLLRE